MQSMQPEEKRSEIFEGSFSTGASNAVMFLMFGTSTIVSVRTESIYCQSGLNDIYSHRGIV